MNCRDSETMEAALEENGHTVVPEKYADCAIVNSCSVRESAEWKAINRLRLLTAKKKNGEDFIVGVAGCMAQRLGDNLFATIPGLDFIVGTGNFHRVAEALERVERGEKRVLIIGGEGPYGPQSRRMGLLRPSANVSISRGCPMRCSYCIVPKVRGNFVSRPTEDIIAEVKALAARGTKEIVLLGQIVNLYDFKRPRSAEGKSPFVQLLERVHAIDGIERIGFLSPHPCGFRSDLLECFERLPKLRRSVHLPIQSGSNRILRAMGRGYGVENVVSIVEKLRHSMWDCSISTDLIVGFPGEEESDFLETEKLFDAIDFDMAFIFKFSGRSGTAAASLPSQIPEAIAAERNGRLLERLAATSLRRNNLFLNKTLDVLVEGKSKKDDTIAFGHSHQGKKVFFGAPPSAMGSMVKVQIESTSVAALSGSILPQLVSNQMQPASF
jgi:tRNA-2-methylthio-N6-dimethylallyladenosine synthase